MFVARIEQQLAGTGVKVTSPDRIKSSITGGKREVDASLRTTIGSLQILITIECRKRKASQDVTWMEQLASKRQAIGAARTIAVASSSFSKEAIQAAEFYGIDLRILSEIQDAELQSELQSWCLPSFVVHVYKHSDIIEGPNITFRNNPGDDFSALAPREGIADAINSPIFHVKTGPILTLNDIWQRADEQINFFDKVPKDDKVHIRSIRISPSDEISIETRLGFRRVESILMKVGLRWKHEHISLSAANVFSYTPASATDVMRPQIRAEFESKQAMNANIRLALQFQSGDTNAASEVFTVQLTPGKSNEN